MDHATEIAHRIIPTADSELPLSAHARAILMEHAANIIRAELDDEYERGKRHGADDRRMIERRNQEQGREILALKAELAQLKMKLHKTA